MQESTFSRRHNGVEMIVDCCACADACKHTHQKQATNPRLPDARSTRTEMSDRQRTGVNHHAEPMGSSPADAATPDSHISLCAATIRCIQQIQMDTQIMPTFLKFSNSCYRLVACWFHFEKLPVIAKSFQKQAAQKSSPAVLCCTSPTRTCTCPQDSTQQTREMNTQTSPSLLKNIHSETQLMISSHKIPTHAIQLIFNMIFKNVTIC